MNEQQALTKLRAMLPPGTTVYTVLRHVSQSGMTRVISPIVVVDGEPTDISGLMTPLGFTFNQRHDGLTVRGCGMDMGFHLVYSLSWNLYPDGFECPGPLNCDRPSTHPHNNGDGGYALNQRWL